MIQASSSGRLLICIAIVVVMALVTWGCGGGTCGCTEGGVIGWVYVSLDGSSVMIIGNRVAPDGYVPAEGAHAFIEGLPWFEDIVDETGRYAIYGIPPGTHTIVIEDSEGTRLATITVPVRACEITIGGGHSEGGGGL